MNYPGLYTLHNACVLELISMHKGRSSHVAASTNVKWLATSITYADCIPSPRLTASSFTPRRFGLMVLSAFSFLAKRVLLQVV